MEIASRVPGILQELTSWSESCDGQNMVGRMMTTYISRNEDTANESVAVGTAMTITLLIRPPVSTKLTTVSIPSIRTRLNQS